MLGHELPVRADEPGQIQPPLVQAGLLLAVGGAAVGRLLGVARVEPGNDLPHEGCGLPADIPLPVHQQFVEKGQGLNLLATAEIDGVGLQYAQGRPQAPPVRLSPGLLQQSREAALSGKAAHEGHIMLHAHHPQGLHRLRGFHKGRIHPGRGTGKPAGQGGIHPQALHIALKIPELGIYEGVPGAFFVGDVVQLVQNNLKGLGQGGNPGDFPAVCAPVLLHPEIGVDQSQALRRQTVQLQVPHRMVGGHIAHILHMAAEEPYAGIIVVQIGHPLAGAAAEFTDIMPRRSGGHQRQVDGHPRPPHVPGHTDGNMVDSRDMFQRPPGSDLQPQAHHLIDKFPPPGAQKQPVAVLVSAAGQLVLLQQRQVPQWVRRRLGPLGVKKRLEQRQEKDRPRTVTLPAGLKVRLRKHGFPGKVVRKGQPPLLRAGRQRIQLLLAQIQHGGAGYAPAVAEWDEPLEVVFLLQPLPQQGAAGSEISGGGLGGGPAQQAAGQLPDTFLVHSGVLLGRRDRSYPSLCTKPPGCARRFSGGSTFQLKIF